MSKRMITAMLAALFVLFCGTLCGCAAARGPGAGKTGATESKAQPDTGGIKKPADGALKKLSTRLLQLADENYLPEGKTKEQLIREMTASKVIAEKQAGGGEKTLCAHVYIKLSSADGAALLEDFIARDYDWDENAKLMAAWLDIRRIWEAAALTEVKSISEVLAPVTRGQ